MFDLNEEEEKQGETPIRDDSKCLYLPNRITKPGSSSKSLHLQMRRSDGKSVIVLVYIVSNANFVLFIIQKVEILNKCKIIW